MRWLALITISITLSIAVNSTGGNAGLEGRGATVASPTCLPETDVSNAVQRLSSSLSDPELAQVRKVLFGDAKKGQKCRQQVITVLMKAMDKPNLDLFHDQPSFSYWDYGARLLGQLKATEALDLLIAHLNATDGLSPNMNHYPAVEGVIMMGPIAIPKLAAALRQNTDRYLRRNAIFCVASIGGLSAKRALKQALPFESDRCDKEFILASLEAFKNRRTPNRITFEPERSKWYAAFECGGQ